MNQPGQVNRRMAMAGAVAGFAAFAGLAQTAGAASAVDGVAGGGLVPTGTGSNTVQFSLAIVQIADAKAPVLAGAFVLTDPHADGGPTVLQSTSLDELKVYATDHPNARQLTGNVSVNGDGAFPFLLQVEAETTPGKKPTLNVVVGQAALPYLSNGSGNGSVICSCAAYSYALKGEVQNGNLALVKAG